MTTRKTFTPAQMRDLADGKGSQFLMDDMRSALRYAADLIDAATAVIEENCRAAGAALDVVAQERERCALIADDEARIREEAGRKHPEDSEARKYCWAGARAATNIAKGIRNGEIVAGVPLVDGECLSRKSPGDSK